MMLDTTSADDQNMVTTHNAMPIILVKNLSKPPIDSIPTTIYAYRNQSNSQNH
jgi:hypothetical protein